MKKWTFLLAAGLLAGAAPVFTGCIDNDEPEGISILRGAKAELIKAKKAVADAEAQQKMAEAELKKAEAKIKEAEAEIAKAKAEQIKAQTEAEKAKLEAEIKKIEAEANLVLAQAEAAAQAAADAHKKALQELEVLKATLYKEQQAALQTWIDRYDVARGSADAAQLAYAAAQRKYLIAQKDAETFDSDDVEKQNELEKELRAAQKQLKNLTDIQLAGLNEELAEWENNMKPGELPTRLEAVRAEIEQLKAEDAQLNVKILDIMKSDPDYAKMAELEEQQATINKESIVINEVQVEFPEMGIPGYNGTIRYFIDNWEYTLEDNELYEIAKEFINVDIAELEGLKLDENDQAWTEQKIIDLKAEQKKVIKKFNKAKVSWEEAVNAYKTNNGKVNLAAFDTYAPLEEAVNAYNATVVNYDKAMADWEAADQAYRDAIGNEEATQTLEAIKFETILNAAKTCQEKINALNAEVEAKKESKAKEYQKRDNTNFGLYVAWQKAIVEYRLNPSEATQKAIKDAEAAYNKGINDLKEWDAAAEAEINKMVADTWNKQADLRQMFELEKLQAEKDYKDKLAEYGNQQKDPALQEAIKAAKAELDAKEAALNDVKKVVDKAFESLDKAYVAFNKDIEKVKTLINEYKKMNVADIAKLSRKDAKQLVIKRSKEVWGTQIAQGDADTDYDIPSEYLIGIDKAAVDAIIRSWMPGLENWEIAELYDYSNWFGLFGDMLAGEHGIAIAEATLNNPAAIDGVIKQLTDALATIEADYQAQVDKANKVANEYQTLEAKVNEKLQALTDRREEIAAEIDLNMYLEMALQNAIGTLPEAEQYTQADIDEAIAALKEAIEETKEDILVAEGVVKVKEQAIEDFKNGKLNSTREAEEEMNVAKDKYELAEKRAKEAKADLDKAIAALENAE